VGSEPESGGGTDGSDQTDAAVQDVAQSGEASFDEASVGDSGWVPGGDPAPDGKPGIHLCPTSWNQQQCCDFLCSCMQHLCTDSPMDAPRIPMCMSMCLGLTDMRARCQVYHCFESVSPSGVKDHLSHCGHASGRVGGGACPYMQ
jgi:hypothetical protein